MSTNLNVWSNHKLRYDFYEEGINKFELNTGRKLKHWNFKHDEPLVKTAHITQIEYFTNFDILKFNFENWNTIRIWTNFTYCDEIALFRNTMKIYPTGFKTRYSEWQKLTTGVFVENDNDKSKQMLNYRNNWILFRRYCHEITIQLGGDKIIYLDDFRYQIQEDKFIEGESFEKVIQLLSEVREPCTLEMFELFPTEFTTKATWYYDDIKKTEHNIV